jgi:hypothetical protein
MPKEENPESQAAIDVAVLVNIPDIGALASLNVERIGLKTTGLTQESSRYHVLRACP